MAKCKKLVPNKKKKLKNKKRLLLNYGLRERLKKHRDARNKKKRVFQVKKSKNFKELKKQSRKNSKVMNITKRKILKEPSNYIRQQQNLIQVNFFTIPIWPLSSLSKRNSTKQLNSAISQLQKLERAHTTSLNSQKSLLARLQLTKRTVSSKKHLMLMLKHCLKTMTHKSKIP